MGFPTPLASFNSNDPHPDAVENLTAAWLSKILNENVEGVNIVKVLHGTASKILVELDFGSETQIPKRLCIKGGFNPEQRALALDGIYRREAEFFYYIAPNVDMRVPRAWYVGTDPGQGIVILEDLTVENCTFGECTEPWPVERVRRGLKDLAALHALTWGAKTSEFPFLEVSEDDGMVGVLEAMLSPFEWSKRFDDDDARPPVDESLIDRERMHAAYKVMWKTRNPKFRCILHGDPHIGNTYITADGNPGFVDFQCLHPGSAMHDVAYFLVGALTIDDRRKNERDLLKFYLESLHAAGGPKFTVDETWEEYRKNHLHGFCWPLSGPVMQPKEKVNAMSARHSAAIMDHKSVELFEAMPEYQSLARL